jgi:ankyrin repeat protein
MENHKTIDKMDDLFEVTWGDLNTNDLVTAEKTLDLFPYLLTARNRVDRLLIHNSILTYNCAACELLLRKGCPVDSRYVGNTSLLSYICQRNWKRVDMLLNMIKLFVSYGADVNAVDDYNETALMIICRRYATDLPVVNYLIGQGANVNIRKNNKQTCLGYAIMENNQELFLVLLRNGARLYQIADVIMLDVVFGNGSFVRLFKNYVKLTLCSARCVHRLGQRSSLRLLSVDIIRSLYTFL